jgi:hypothetical protein
MLDIKVRQLFQRWRLYEKESIFGVTICYDIEWVLHLERYFRPDERSDLYDMIFDLFFKYEYHWQQLSARKIALLLWVHHSYVDDILNKNKSFIRRQIENQTKNSAKNENLNILL